MKCPIPGSSAEWGKGCEIKLYDFAFDDLHFILILILLDRLGVMDHVFGSNETAKYVG